MGQRSGFFDCEPSLTSTFVQNFAGQLGAKRLKVFSTALHANEAVERWHKTICRHIASFVFTGSTDCDQRVVIEYFRYTARFCYTIKITLLNSMVGIDDFEAWSELGIDSEKDESVNLAKRLSKLRKHLMDSFNKARSSAAKVYNKTSAQANFEVEDQVLL